MKLRSTALWMALALTAPAWAQDIVIGQSVPLSGSNADIGRDMRDGALAVFAKANAANAGNPAWRKIQLVTLDNANNRQRAAENTQQLLGQHNAMALFGYNSATNSIEAVALAAQHNMLFFAPFSGATGIRNSPNVYTVRASYREEALKIIEAKRAIGADRALILHYDDEVGRANYEAVAAAYAELGAARPRGVAVKRGAAMDAAAIDVVLKDAPHCVLATTQFSQVHDLLKAGSTRGTPVAVAALSFVNPDELAESVGAEARGTVVSQVIPAPRPSNQVSVPVIRECAEALAAHSGAKLNYTTLESCIAAKALVEALKKAGPKVTREGLLQAMGSLGRLDLGGFSLQFSPKQRQGSQWVELTILARGNRFVH